MKAFTRIGALALATVALSALAPLEGADSAEMEVDAPVVTVAVPEIDELLSAEVTGGEDFTEVEEPAALPEDLTGLVDHFVAADPGDEQLECLAGAVYFETRGEPLEGQLAVAQVVANRADSPRFPNNYCDVVFQRSQFSFVSGGKMPPIKRGTRAWKRAVAVARIVDGEHRDSAVPEALFFHARYVSPGWRLKRVGTVGNHIFYQ